jgi:hypothetical protein
MKRCPKCKETRPESEFNARFHKGSKEQRIYEHKTVFCEARRAKWFASNPGQPWRTRRWSTGAPMTKEQAKEARLRHARQYRREVRQELIRRYGGKCACCGESTPEFLAIDHINRDGAAERREFSPDLAPRILKLGCPRDRFQLLCHNCNMSKEFNGVCPHQRASLMLMA